MNIWCTLQSHVGVLFPVHTQLIHFILGNSIDIYPMVHYHKKGRYTNWTKQMVIRMHIEYTHIADGF
jgi:hypothetical protein